MKKVNKNHFILKAIVNLVTLFWFKNNYYDACMRLLKNLNIMLWHCKNFQLNWILLIWGKVDDQSQGVFCIHFNIPLRKINQSSIIHNFSSRQSSPLETKIKSRVKWRDYTKVNVWRLNVIACSKCLHLRIWNLPALK